MPKGCDKIYVDLEDDRVIVSYGSKANETGYMCKETGEHEIYPRLGDFSIFWNDGEKDEAVCANFRGRHILEEKRSFKASNGKLYDNAIKFRNLEQYLMVRGIYDDEI